MGLDMYLTRKHYIGGKWEFNDVKGEINITIGNKHLPIDLNKLDYIIEEVGYWRKANQIHNWFVKNVQDGEDDCKSYYVEIEQLKKLLEICKTIKDTARLVPGKIKAGKKWVKDHWEQQYEEGKIIENVDEIKEKLPTTDGFFFGSTEYDEWYLEEIKTTIKILDNVVKEDEELNKLGFSPEYEYRASW